MDLIAKDGKIESLSATLDTLNLTDDAKAVKVKELTDEVAALKKQIDEQRKQSKLLKKNTRALEKQLSKASTETEASVLENSKEFANERKELETRILDLGEELMQERTRSIELEAELARQALNREISNSQTLAASSDNSSQPIDELKQMSEEISAELKVLAKKKPTQKEKNDLRESIRTLGSKTSSIA